jgi:hypothetical protein
MIERQTELMRRHKRKKKMRQLKEKLTTAQGPDREKILYKIHRLSPWWTEEGIKPKAPAAEDAEPKKKAPAKPKKEKA